MKAYIYPVIIIAIIITTLIGGLIVYKSTYNVSNMANSQFDTSVRNSEYVLELSKLLSDIAYKNFALSNNSTLTVSYIRGVQEDMENDINKMSVIISKLNFKSKEVQKAWLNFQSYFKSLQKGLFKADIQDTVSFMQSDLKTIIDYSSSQLSNSKESINNSISAIRKEILTSLIIVVSFESFFVVLLLLNAFRPLLLFVEKLRILSSGNFNFNFNLKHSGVFKKPITELSNFKDKINNSFIRIKKVSFSMENKSKRILDDSKSFFDRIRIVSENEDNISKAANEIKLNTSKLLDNTNRSLQIVDDTVRLVTNTGILMSDTNNAVEQVFLNSKKLEEIFKFIDQVALQTNILAINASVEASKAGDYGKIFALIAQDIRSLSMKTSKYSEDSKKIINSNISNIEEVRDLSNKVIASFASMEKKFTELTKEVEVIGDEIPKEHEKIAKISDNVYKISEILKEYTKNMENLTLISGELSKDSQLLTSIYETFKLQEKNE